MTYRMPRVSGRPSRSATNIIIRSSVALPRSGRPAHCDALARGGAADSGGLLVIGNEHAVCDRLPRPQDAEAYRAVRHALVPEGEDFARMHGADELRRADAPV